MPPFTAILVTDRQDPGHAEWYDRSDSKINVLEDSMQEDLDLPTVTA